MTLINQSIYNLADNHLSKYGSGGMLTKLDAAKICMNSGCNMFIGNGSKKNPIKNMIEKNSILFFHQKFQI